MVPFLTANSSWFCRKKAREFSHGPVNFEAIFRPSPETTGLPNDSKSSEGRESVEKKPRGKLGRPSTVYLVYTLIQTVCESILSLRQMAETDVEDLAVRLERNMDLSTMEQGINKDTLKPLTTGCWLPRDNNNETWIEFRYERLQDFCYRCGRIGHTNIECSFAAVKGGMVGYGEWTRAAPVRDFIESPRPLVITSGERRYVGAIRVRSRSSNQYRRADCIREASERSINETMDPNQAAPQKEKGKGTKRWHRIQRRSGAQNPNPGQWIMQGCRPMGYCRLVMGFEPMEVRREYGSNPLVLIEEIPEVHSTQSEGGTVVPLPQPQTAQTTQRTDSRKKKKKQNKTKTDEENRRVKERKERAAERFRTMTIRERCLKMEMAIYAEEELQEVPIEYQDMWDYMEEISAGEKNALMAKKVGSSSRGGGSWPSIATRSP
ncbi:hypothetical protein D8674_040344 [Pyrus ussuriensis x Pyrus communis]|uniref:CCHC-type domain-containing protein n=1 Tax=Pyrus ussuriensis x Pyrus communis TaxID=2448454 RepID=A0A5N5H2W1_9ROSA|nr:hypothetical protein D8674_040344 [Pyrus ussuriensis x Pyrus communis]